MIHFTPTLGIKDTAKNVNIFIKDNMQVFWDIFKPFIPYIVALTILDVVVTELFMPVDPDTNENYEFPLGSLIVAYFYTCLAITWHRVVIHGAENYEPMNPFKPKKSELAFIFMGIGIFVAFMAASATFIFVAAFINPILLFLLLPFFIFGTYIWVKLMFYFPAKATGRHISLKESYKMTKGYIWKLMLSSFLAYLKLFLIVVGYSIVALMLITGIIFATDAIGINQSAMMILLQSLFMIPLACFFQPLFAVIWVTVLSNYYQYVLQNEPLDSNENTND